MTLRTRNRSLIIFIILSFLCLGFSFAALFYQVHTGNFEQIFGCKFLSFAGLSLFEPTNKSVIFGLLFLQVYIPVTALFLYFSFEKTQSTLIILFAIFLLGCQFQIAKLFIGLLNYKMTFSLEYLCLGKTSIMGKLLALASFFLIASEAKDSRKLNIEMDICILLVSCLVITIAVPLRTAVPSKNFGITLGYTTIVNTLGLITALLTILTFLVSYRETEEKVMIKLLISYCHIIVGFFILTSTNILWCIIIGCVLISVGTHLFLSSLHKMYLWD